MSSFSRLGLWLALVQDSEDEAALLDAWYEVSPHLLQELTDVLETGQTAQLAHWWETIRGEEVGLFFDYLCTASGSLQCADKSDSVESSYLRRTLQRRLVSAGIAGALHTRDARLLAEWLRRIEVDPRTLSAPDTASSAASAAGALFRRLQAQGHDCAEIEDGVAYLLHRLGSDASPQTEFHVPLDTRRCPVLIHKDGRTGTVGWLTVETFASEQGGIFPDIEAMGLTPLSRTFLDAITLGYTLAQADPALQGRPLPSVRWKIQSGIDAWEGRILLEGGSHGAACAVALIQLLRGESLDSKTVLTMTLNAAGAFGKVSGVYAKVQAAFAQGEDAVAGQIRRVVVHPDNENEARAAAAGMGRDLQEAILVCRTLPDFLPEASGILGELRAFLAEEIREIVIDARMRTQRHFRDWAEFQKACVPLRVWRMGSGGGASVRQAESAVWSEAVQVLQRALVLGSPGSGKTTLLWQEAGRRCQAALEQYGVVRPATPREARFACFVRAAEIAENLPDVLLEPLPFLAALCAALGTRHQWSEVFQGFLEEKLRNGDCLIVLDGLDEVPVERQADIVRELHSALKALPQARLLLSARREWTLTDPQSLTQGDNWEVLPLEPAQVAQAIERHFSALPEVGKALRTQINAQPALRRVLTSPLLLRIACEITRESWQEKRVLPQWGRRVQLYEAFLQNLTLAWTKRAPRPTAAQQALFLPLASEAAWELLSQQLSAPTQAPRSTAQMLNQVQQNYPMMAGRSLLDDLCSAGIVMYAGADRLSPTLVFMHRTFGEYLAARALARRIEAEGWHVHRARVNALASQAAWWEVILFLAGILKEPLPLLQLLTDRSRDDALRRRLALAAECLAEIPVEWMSAEKGQPGAASGRAQQKRGGA